MGKNKLLYEEIVGGMKAPEGWSELSPYKWKQVEPGSRGEKKTLFKTRTRTQTMKKTTMKLPSTFSIFSGQNPKDQ